MGDQPAGPAFPGQGRYAGVGAQSFRGGEAARVVAEFAQQPGPGEWATRRHRQVDLRSGGRVVGLLNLVSRFGKARPAKA